MSDNTIIQQGYFTSDGTDKYIPLRSSADWVKVYNLTNIAGATQWAGLTWWWQYGIAQGDAITEYHNVAAGVTDGRGMAMSTCAVGYNAATYRGIWLFDTSNQTPGGAIAVTAGTNATRPVYSTGTTTSLSAGAIVRIQNTAHAELNGLDFSIDTVVAATSFRLANTLATAPGVIAGAAGTYRFIAPNLAAYKLMYPSTRVIANITQAANAVVTTLVDHGYSIGQTVRFKIPQTINGMVELNDVIGTVIATPTAATFTVNVDTTGMTAFAFATAAQAAVPLQYPQVIPLGDSSILGATTLAGATTNQSTIGILLGTSATAAIALGSAGGTNGDVIKWVAGKSFANDIP